MTGCFWLFFKVVIWFSAVLVCFFFLKRSVQVVFGMIWVGQVGLDRFMPSINEFRLLHVVSRCFTFFVYVVENCYRLFWDCLNGSLSL